MPSLVILGHPTNVIPYVTSFCHCPSFIQYEEAVIAKQKNSDEFTGNMIDAVEETEAVDQVAKSAAKATFEDIKDEVNSSEIYLKNRKVCSMDFYPDDTENIDEFRNNVEKYFKQKPDVVEKVIDCKVANYGKRVRLTSLVKSTQWLIFFNAPERNYPDLHGVRTIRHACRDLANCDPEPT